MKRLCIAILLLLCTRPAVCADWDLGQNGNVNLHEFRSCGYDDNNRLAWQIAGRNASVRGAITTIENCELIFFHTPGKQNDNVQSLIKKVILKAKTCDFNYAMGEIKSDQSIDINLSDSIRMTGIGFDVDLKRHVILLRSTVNLKLKLDSKTTKALKKGALK